MTHDHDDDGPDCLHCAILKTVNDVAHARMRIERKVPDGTGILGAILMAAIDVILMSATPEEDKDTVAQQVAEGFLEEFRERRAFMAEDDEDEDHPRLHLH